MMEIHSPYKNIFAPLCDLYSSFVNSFVNKSGDVALVDCPSGERLTFDDVRIRSDLVARRLLQDGFRTGDRLALCCTNCLDYVVFLVATVRLGGVVVGINHILTAGEIEKELEMVNASFVFTGFYIAPKLFEVAKTIKLQIYVSGHPTTASHCVTAESIYKSHLKQRLPALSDLGLDPGRDPCAILFSSGTTGLPKPVVLTHYNMVVTIWNILNPDVSMAFGRHVLYQPICHVFGLCILLLGLTNGDVTYVMRKFDVEEYIKEVARHKSPCIHVAPPVAVQLTKSDVLSRYDTSHIRDVLTGAGPIPANIERGLLQKLAPGARFRQVYGMTESAGVITLTPWKDHPLATVPSGSVGLLAPNTSAKVVDVVSGTPLGPGQEGEIWVRGPQVMAGYGGRPEATADILDPEGWLHTGDIGKYDQDGFFFITDRKKDLIKYKGYQVAPVELESILVTHPDVSDAAVFSLPHEINGELPRAWVVRKAGRAPTEAQLHSFMDERVAAFKKLRGGILFVDKIPRSASGKIFRRAMREADKLNTKL